MGMSQKNVDLQIEGMMCINCRNKVEKALTGTPGVESAAVSHEAGTAKVAYDESQITPAAIAEVVDGLGFKVISR